jgi:hypothetical protein
MFLKSKKKKHAPDVDFYVKYNFLKNKNTVLPHWKYRVIL